MASTEVIWPASVVDGCCLKQNVIANANFDFNGQYAIPLKDGSKIISFTYLGFVRNITITADNLNGTTIVIIGIQNGITVTETLGPISGSTTVSIKNYSIINSIKPSQGLTNATVGTGVSGYFSAINIAEAVDPRSNAYAFSFSTQATNGCTYTIYEMLGTLTDFTYDQLVADQFAFPVGGARTLSEIIQFTAVCSYILIKVGGANTSSLRMQFLPL